MATENCNSARDLPPCEPFIPRASRRKRIRSEVDHPHPISELGDDMLVEVLIRVPEARFACCCKTVCKRWNSLISDPFFARLFVPRHQSGNGGDTTLMPSYSTLSFLPVPDEVKGHFWVFDSFKDLLLCGFMDFCHNDDQLGRSYLVCNPVTKQWLPLPVAPESSMQYTRVVASLVCEPRSNSDSSNNNLDRGDGHSSEYQFRVVCIHQSERSIRLDVFCSESGEWTKEALVLDGKLHERNVISNNGELFWWYLKPSQGADQPNPLLARFNPFRLDTPPTSIDASAAFFGKQCWDIAVSQDALHIVAFDVGPTDCWSRNTLSVWRLEKDCKSWREQYQIGLDRSSEPLQVYGGYDCGGGVLHSKKPEIVFLAFDESASDDGHSAILSCNLRSGEITEFSEPGQVRPHWPVFQLWSSCWPTPIPRYEELRGIYDGRYGWLVQDSSKAKAPSLNNQLRKKCATASHLPGAVLRSRRWAKGSCKLSGVVGRKLSTR